MHLEIINVSLSNLTLTHVVCYLAPSLSTFISVELGKFGKDNESTMATAHANLKTALNLALTNLPNSTEIKVLMDGPNSKLHVLVLYLIC